METPRDKFQLNKAALKQHADFSDSSALAASFDVTLLEMMWRGKDTEGPGALEQQYMLRGAMDFVSIWRGLSDVSQKPQQFGGPGLVSTNE